MKTPTAALGALEWTLNRFLALDANTARQMGALEGKVIALHLRGLDLTLYVLPGANGLQLLDNYEGDADAVVSGTPLALMRMGLSQDASAVLFAGDVRIDGDTEVGQRLKRLLDGMEIDWEEQLSHWLGDAGARQTARAVRALHTWGRRTADHLGEDVAEYLHEESRQLPPTSEVTVWLDAVDVLRADTDRLQARVQRLQQALAPAAADRADN